MKYFVFILMVGLMSVFSLESSAQTQYKVVTSVESVVPMGIGRSRIIDAQGEKDYANYTTDRSKGQKNETSRKDLKTTELEETKLLNFYSAAGINFSNIASNDMVISSKINALVEEGWELAFVTSGVESDAGKGDGKGLFITRYIFKKSMPVPVQLPE
ncbi:hypothetical protein [Persicobacter diffluens]|uniref:Uncharacterized protein n=1 Tax=Persicobacter diffluens TaxID=981 RepID=A0AAN5AK42_9BACT|nr:hypothetical protein PEDI_21960 [Persicobacter diffluens]